MPRLCEAAAEAHLADGFASDDEQKPRHSTRAPPLGRRHGALRGLRLDKEEKETHLADGYASDDEQKPRRSARGYGALKGDLPPRRARLSEEEARAYEVRQSSSGPSSSKVRYLDAVLGHYSHDPSHHKRQRLALSQTQIPGQRFQRHLKLMSLLPKGPAKTDFQLLKEAHRFLREDEDDDGSWESKLAQKYYQRLFKEYVICDLTGYKKGNVGFRWRTEAEVVQGRGQFQCGHKHCQSKVGLQSFEVDFKYREAGLDKRALVKVRLCEDCAYKLHYKRLKAERRKRRKDKHRKAKRSERGAVEIKSESAADEASGAESDAGEKGDLQESPAPSTEQEKPSEADKRTLESLAWKGPDPEARTREDDFDDYFNDLFC